MASPDSASAGHGGTPLPRKLGMKPGSRIAIVHPPAGFGATLGVLPPGVSASGDVDAGAGLDLVLFFTRSADELRARFAALSGAIHPAGMLWIAWPKQASRVATDLTENVVRDVALERGMVDVKVCATDATWSGLKLVYRLADRPKP